MKRKNKINVFVQLILIIFLLFAVYIGNAIFFPHMMPGSTYRFIINKDEPLKNVANRLYQDKIITNSKIFLIMLRILRDDKKVNAGLYFLKHPMSLWSIIHRVTNGKPDEISVKILEGVTFDQLKAYIDSIPDITHTTLNQKESDIKLALKIPYPNLEGVFYPDTYFVVPNQSDLEIYYHAYKTMEDKINTMFTQKENWITLRSPYELLVLASLIQKETAKADDMIMVSTVFNNRLRVNMKLQDDPAVFYGLKNKSTVTRRDFQIDTPYNTYMHAGLPPTPICIPSQAALDAALHPINQQDVFYFVAIGNGKTKFSKSYNEHKKAVNKYLKK